MAEDLFAVLTRFHREIALPQIEASIDSKVNNLRGGFLTVLTRFHREIALPQIEASIDSKVNNLRGDFLTHFDAIYGRFDRLESEYQALAAAVARLESQYGSLESQHRTVIAAVARIEARN